MHQGQEERERDQQKILELYKALQLRIDSDMKEMMRDPEVSKLSDMSQILDRILTSIDCMRFLKFSSEIRFKVSQVEFLQVFYCF